MLEVLRRPVESAQFTSVRYGERLAELGALPSVGSVGDSYDNALAETINGLYKTELIRGPDQGPWRTVEEVELATLSWVHWYNTERLHGYLGDVPPDEYEETHHAQQTTRELIGTNKKSLHQTQGDSVSLMSSGLAECGLLDVGEEGPVDDVGEFAFEESEGFSFG
jgi:hypothetical protein